MTPNRDDKPHSAPPAPTTGSTPAQSDAPATALLDDLVRRLQAGDDTAFDPFYRESFPSVYRICFRISGGAHDVEDIVQEVYELLYRNIRKFEWRSQFTTWMYRICANAVAGRRRWSKVSRLIGLGETPDELLPAVEPRADKDLESQQMNRAVWRALEPIGEKKRIVFVLYEMEEVPAEEIAEILGIPLNTVYSRLRHARAEFKTRFEKQTARENAGWLDGRLKSGA